MIGALLIVDPLDQLGDDEVEVEIALAVAVAAHVDRHAVDESGEVGAVIEVEAAQEILVGLAGAGMLGGDEARDILRQLADPRDRLGGEVGIADDSLRSGLGGSDLLQLAAVDDDLGLVVCRPRRLRPGRFHFGGRSRGADNG